MHLGTSLLTKIGLFIDRNIYSLYLIKNKYIDINEPYTVRLVWETHIKYNSYNQINMTSHVSEKLGRTWYITHVR